MMLLKINPQREMACASLEPLQKSRAGLPKVYQDHDHDGDVGIYRRDDEKKYIKIIMLFIVVLMKKIDSNAMEPQIGGKELGNNRKAPQDDSSCNGDEVAKILVHGATL